jgi:2-oxoisovalerate dehydrogenase E1 component
MDPDLDLDLDLPALYRAMMTPRLIEEKMLRLIRQGRLSKWFSGYGQEAIAVGTAFALTPEDTILPMHRNLGVWTTRGVPLRPLFCQLMGKEGGFTKGRDRTFHFGIPEYGIVGMISHLAAMLPVADGLALGAKLDGADRVAVAFTGEGATREGDFHEALSLAAVWKLPAIFIVENNGYGLSTPTSQALPETDLSKAGAGYGMIAETHDGNDVFAVIRAVRAARKRAVSGEGPTLLNLVTFRMRGHEEASGTKYVPQALMDDWAAKDPVLRLEHAMADALPEEERARVRSGLTAEIDEIAEWALEQPEVTSSAAAERNDVFAVRPRDGRPTPTSGSAGGDGAPATREMRFIDAVSEGLRTALREDERTVLMGQDIAEYGGVFKVSAGFLEEFGPDRIRNTPIIENGAVGAAMGLALAGWKPILEIQYFDFISCGFNQIVNNLATTHYRWGAPVNVTVRAPIGGGIGAGPFHSQSMEAWFCHTPGLKVVFPSDPVDAKGLLLSAIDDPNPVLFLEHKALYRSLKADVPEQAYRTPLGEARCVREGTRATIVAWGAAVHWAVQAAEAHDLDVEILDLRTLIPWDRQAVVASVRKTHRLLVVHEAPRTGGFGAEVVAEMMEATFEHLDAPPVRIGGEDMPIPFSKSLEDGIYSGKSRLPAALRDLLAY